MGAAVQGRRRKFTSDRMIKGLLSAFIVFHLFAVIIAANYESYLASKTAFLTRRYLNLFGLVSSWGFFAPDPGPPPIQIDYAALDQEGHTVQTGTWPPDPSTLVFREQFNRRITSARFMFMADQRIEKMLIPYICNSVAGTKSVQLWKTVKYQKSFAEISQDPAMMKGKLGPPAKEMERIWVADGFCDQKPS